MFWGGGNFSCRHPKLWSYIKSNVKAFFITGAIVFTISASATVVLHSRQVRYKNDKSVEQAINELYEKADELYGYHIGDEIKVNGIDFYVIADSPLKQDYVVALKKEPLTVAEVNQFGGVGTEDNHVNKFTYSSIGTSTNVNGYGGMAYYSSEFCGYLNGSFSNSGCKTQYIESDIKYVVDKWFKDKFQNNELKLVDGYSARLIKKDEYYVLLSSYDWRYNNQYRYWTMTNVNNIKVYSIYTDGSVYEGDNGFYSVVNLYGTIRPVINVYKSAIQKTN